MAEVIIIVLLGGLLLVEPFAAWHRRRLGKKIDHFIESASQVTEHSNRLSASLQALSALNTPTRPQANFDDAEGRN